MFIIIVFLLGCDRPSELLLFVPVVHFSILMPLFCVSSSVSLSYFILAVPMRECLGKHSCMSSQFPIAPIKKFIVMATSRMIGIHRSTVDLRRRQSSALQSFPIISNAGSAAFQMLALVGNAIDSVLQNRRNSD